MTALMIFVILCAFTTVLCMIGGILELINIIKIKKVMKKMKEMKERGL